MCFCCCENIIYKSICCRFVCKDKASLRIRVWHGKVQDVEHCAGHENKGNLEQGKHACNSTKHIELLWLTHGLLDVDVDVDMNVDVDSHAVSNGLTY